MTRGAQPAGGDAVAFPSQAPLWGFGKTVALEQPDLGCARVDLSSARRPGEAEELARELCESDGEDQVALRAEGRFVARLERWTPAPAEGATLRGDATYLITGGLGGLGLTLGALDGGARARHLSLVGRSEPSAAAREAIAAMTEAGADVRVMRGDVSRTLDVHGIVDEIQAGMPSSPGWGTPRAARGRDGAGDDRGALLGPRALQGAGRVPPRRGDAAPAARLLRDVLVGRVARRLARAGRLPRRPAPFLDGAHRRRGSAWPRWPCNGAPSRTWGSPRRRRTAASGSRTAGSGASRRGHRLFARMLAHPCPEVGLLRMSVRQWMEAIPAPRTAPSSRSCRRPAATRATRGRRPPRAGSGTSSRTCRRARRAPCCWAGNPRVPEPRAARARGPHRRGRALPRLRDGFADEPRIRNRLEASLGLRLSAAILFTHPTTTALLDHLLEEMGLVANELDQSIDRLPEGDMSEEDAAAMLDEKLQGLEDYLR